MVLDGNKKKITLLRSFVLLFIILGSLQPLIHPRQTKAPVIFLAPTYTHSVRIGVPCRRLKSCRAHRNPPIAFTREHLKLLLNAYFSRRPVRRQIFVQCCSVTFRPSCTLTTVMFPHQVNVYVNGEVAFLLCRNTPVSQASTESKKRE